MVNFWLVPTQMDILLVKKHASRSKKPACKVKKCIQTHLLEMFHLKNRSIIALNIASDSSKFQNIAARPHHRPRQFLILNRSPGTCHAHSLQRLPYNDAYMVSPLVWSIFFGQNADLTSGLHCTIVYFEHCTFTF